MHKKNNLMRHPRHTNAAPRLAAILLFAIAVYPLSVARFQTVSAQSPSDSPKSPATAPDAHQLREKAAQLFGTLEAVPPAKLTEPRVLLGQRLFWDQRLSSTGQIACASCHLPDQGGADNRRFSVDARGQNTSRNSQTVFNAVMQPSLRWVGDRKSGADQAEKSLTGSMGFDSATDVLPLLKQHGYEHAFRNAFPDNDLPLSPANYAAAIEAYEQTLVTPAPFDRYLAGEHNALSAEQLKGLDLFITIGCADCHHGPLLGGESIEKFGVIKEYWTATGSRTRDDGLFKNTKKEADRYHFRTSMLRNIAKTAPYFHDGSVPNLADAIQVMAQVQLGKTLSMNEQAALAAFLDSLSGETPRNYRPSAAHKSAD